MSSHSSDFHARIAAARTRSDEAWRVLYDAHASAVLGYLRAQRAPSPEDLLGEVWLQAARDLDRFDGDEAGFRAWLLRIAHHRLLDARRASTRRPVEVALAGANEAVDDVADRDGIDRLEAEQQLLRLLDGIPERQRSVLYLRFVLDMSQQEVARVLGTSTPALKMLQSRALRALRRRVEALQLEELDADALRSEPGKRLVE